MQVYREQDKVVLKFTRNESSLLQRILLDVRRCYQVPPAELDMIAQDAWYSTRGCLSAGMSSEETVEWIEQLHQFRGSHLVILNKVLTFLGDRGKDGHSTVPLEHEESSALLSVLNDHRLLVAAQKGLGQQEMEMDIFEAIHALEPGQQMALCEIDLLAQIMESILSILPNSGADWRKHVSDEDLFD